MTERRLLISADLTRRDPCHPQLENVGCRDSLCHGSGHGVRDRGRDSVGALRESRKPASGSVESFLLGEPWGRAPSTVMATPSSCSSTGWPTAPDLASHTGPVTGHATAPYGRTFMIDNHWTAGHALADAH